MPQISIIMLTYNREQFISKAIESILDQTFMDFEYVIVDNGSTDESGAIADRYAEKDKRIKVIHCGRNSIGKGRNIGLGASSGEYITFIDDDDYAAPDMIEFLYSLIHKNQADIAVCGSYRVEEGEVFSNITYDELYIMNNSQATEAFLRRKLYNAGMPTKLMRRTLVDKIRFFEEGKYEDIRASYRFFSNANCVVAQGLPKYYVVRHRENNSGAATKHQLLTTVQLREYLYAFHERTQYITEVLPHLKGFVLYSEWSYMISMVEKIHRFGLHNCNEALELMQAELAEHYQEFFFSPHIAEFEKEWMRLYVLKKK